MTAKNEIERFQHNNRTVVLLYDLCPQDPREWDNLTTMACWHRRLKLGDKQLNTRYTEEEFREFVGEEILAILPLYLYDHSDITIRTTPFSCQWDSGQVGFAYITKSNAEKWGCGDGGDWTQEKLENVIRSDVEIYDWYLTDQCSGYQILGLDGEVITDCWGFLGPIENCREEAKFAAEDVEDPAVQEMANELASRATYAGVSP